MLHEERFIQAITDHEQLMHDLQLVQSLHLPQCYIGAGYIRNYVWDVLHDLYQLVVRKSPFFMDNDYYNQRVHRKCWKEQWPKLTIITA
ncbi:nucleotidyltransferase family protein [Paenibacillus amylolyticus]|uniref:nucleotidyltransferase family protein n=1 Tax=Paenibacillus amylolyticus TaxID=1451 RepID=UPI003D9965C3